MRFRLVPGLVFTALLAGGCTSDYSPRADISSVQTIGLVVPSGFGEPGGGEGVAQPDKPVAGEGRIRNSALGTSTGAAAGTAAGVGAGALIGCSVGGPLGPLCWGAVLIGGAVLGGTGGAVAGATVDHQGQGDVVQAHLYEVNQVLPALTQDYLARAALQKRALRIVRDQGIAVHYVAAAWDGERYVPADAATSTDPATDVNLVLAEMSVSLHGDSKVDPNLILSIVMRWDLTRYNAETRSDETWDVMSANYESEKHQLSEWLADDGTLLKTETDAGIDKAMTAAFYDLPAMTRR